MGKLYYKIRARAFSHLNIPEFFLLDLGSQLRQYGCIYTASLKFIYFRYKCKQSSSIYVLRPGVFLFWSLWTSKITYYLANLFECHGYFSEVSFLRTVIKLIFTTPTLELPVYFNVKRFLLGEVDVGSGLWAEVAEKFALFALYFSKDLLMEKTWRWRHKHHTSIYKVKLELYEDFQLNSDTLN